MNAYLDTNGEVLGVSADLKTLSEAQAIWPETTEVVAGAPNDLIPKGHAAELLFHVRRQGAGTVESDYMMRDNLPGYKRLRSREIDARTAILAESATFSFGGKTFALDTASREKWIAIKAMGDVAALFPLTVTCAEGEYSLAQSDVADFCAAGFAAVQSIKDAGRALRQQVDAAADVAAVMAVADNR